MMQNRDALTDGQQRLLDGNTTVFIVVVQYLMDTQTIFLEKPAQVLATTELLGFASSSLIMRTTLTNPASGSVLGRLRFKYVLVDSVSRKSKRLPEWFKTHYRFLSGEPTVSYKDPRVPAEHEGFSFIYRIRDTDTDFNKHANNSVYYRLCIHTAAQALSNGVFKTFSQKNLFQYDVVQTSAVYARECRLDDKICVFVFEDKEQPAVIHNIITRGRTLLFKSTLTFKLPTKTASKL